MEYGWPKKKKGKEILFSWCHKAIKFWHKSQKQMVFLHTEKNMYY